METKKIKIGDLVIDSKLTELRHINPVVVSRYRQAYRNGASMPPIIVKKGTERVVSGNHRCMALKQEYNNDDFVVVEEREYANEREVLEDFFKENSTHGMPLDDFTKKKIIAKTFNLLNQQVNQLMRWITSDLISVNDGNLSLLRALRNEIDKYLKRNEKNKVA